LNYMDSYEKLPSLGNLSMIDFESFRYSPLYIIFCAICKSISDSFVVFQLFHSLVINLIIFRFIYKYSNYRFCAVFFYFLLSYINYNFVVLREALAIATFLFSYDYYRNGSWLKYYVCAFVAFGFHTSGIFVFFLPLLKKLKFNPSYFILLSFCFILFNIFSNNLLFLFQIFLITENIEEQATSYLELFNLNWTIRLYNVCIYAIFPLFFILLRKQNNGNNKYYENMLCVYVLIGMLIWFVPIFYRFTNYITMFYVLLLSDVFFDIAKLRFFSRTRKFAVIGIFSIFYISMSFLSFFTSYEGVEDGKAYRDFYPYHSIFNPVKDPIREKIWMVHFNK